MVKVAKGLAWGALSVALASHLWAANRGLEMTDEASYLLIALNPWETLGHGSFHGFLLRPLYLLGGETIAGIRWAGYLLVLAAAWRLAGAVRLRLGSGRDALAAFCAPVLMVAAMTVYCGGIRVPCYNSMILVGTLLGWSGWLRCGLSRWAGVELGLGFAVAVVGKWTAVPFLMGLWAGLSLIEKNSEWGPSRMDWIKSLLAGAAGLAGLFLYAGLDGIHNTLQAGIIAAQTMGSHGWFIVPKYGWEIFYYLYRMGRAFVWLLPGILLFWWLAKKNPNRWSTKKIATILFAAGLSLAAVRGWWRGGIDQFGKESVLAGCWLLGVVWTVWAVGRRAGGGRRKTEVGGQRTEGGKRKAEGGRRKAVVSGRWPVLWGLVLTPFLCGIGTNTSIADYAGQGTVFFAAAGVLLLGRLPASTVATVGGVALTGLCLLQASRVTSSLTDIYRLGSVLRQDEALRVGPEAGRLKVDGETRRQVESIHAILQREGFRSGDPVVGVDSLCGWVYLAGGSAPGVPWFQRDQREFLRQILARCDVQVLKSSWIWIRSSSGIRNPAGWWPPQVPISHWRQAGEIPFRTDRGAEKLFLLAPKPGY